MIDYYAVLQIPSSANYQQIRNAYRRLAFQYHPDITGNTADTIRMQLVNEAYSVLSNPLKRARYDFLCINTEMPRSSRTTSPKSGSSATAQSIFRPTGEPSFQVHPDITAGGENTIWADRWAIFIRDSIYHILKQFFAFLLYFMPFTFYFIILGRSMTFLGYPWDAKYDMLALALASSVPTLLTVRLFRKRILLRDFFQGIR
jgi:hypothetical protein